MPAGEGRPAPSLEAPRDQQPDDEGEEHEDSQQQRRELSSAASPPAAAAAATPPRRQGPGLPLLALAASLSAGAAYLLLRRVLRGRQGSGGKVRRAAVAKHQVFAAVLALEHPSVPLPPAAGLRLAGRTLVLSDRLDVQSLETAFGCEAWKAERTPAAHTYGPADALVAAGAKAVATVLSEPLGLGPLLSPDSATTPNPAGRSRIHGGGDFGAAVAVAAGLADLALALDELGGARVPAACCGAYALRTTAGVLTLEGAATAAASLAAPALLAADPQALLKAGQALRLPGGGAATEVPHYLVAEDLFAACGDQARAMVPAVVAAVKRWAGPDQAQALSLCEWLFHRVESLAPFMPAGSAPAAGQDRAEHVLQALAAAAEAVQQWEFLQQHGTWVEADQQELPAAVVAFWRQAQQVDDARYSSALAVAAELQAAMRTALADGYVFVLPTTPGPAPPVPAAGQGGSSPEVDAFRQRCCQFAAVASLSGVPQAVLPLPLPGGMPLSISLLALHKRDLALLQAVAKLGPMLEEEAAALAAQQKAQPAAPWQPRAAAAAGNGGAAAGAARGSGSSTSGGPRRGKAGAADAARTAEAEARKEDGNAAFRAGRYEEAARQYSAALQLDPRCAVYWANRGMANLKLGAYGAAEADCDEALKLELSAKALLRRGSARLAQGNVGGAHADFSQVLALEPQNRQARDELLRMQALGGALEGEGPLPGAFG
ncbi:outer envelope mitochondrial [Chlorella sorokiniana]|uniref:Outer envelope mitochondrial n=1 Tax=Chlorella sorokiniana TaxID=3076 RepID=A0A2P6TSA6_CHLSO|nr:outer envelope mitochondrial [Chlorella sorokiniana]|eukprot:PRW56947.1 outer envelope mitochondrial [Chlorella sorokiniana]